MKLERAVHQWRMLEASALLQLEREVRVKALIMAHHTRIQIVEAGEDRQ